jgi:hypothetical protein
MTLVKVALGHIRVRTAVAVYSLSDNRAVHMMNSQRQLVLQCMVVVVTVVVVGVEALQAMIKPGEGRRKVAPARTAVIRCGQQRRRRRWRWR